MSLAPNVLMAIGVLAALAAVLLKHREWALIGLCLASPFGLFYVGPAQLITVMAIAVILVTVGARWSHGETPLPNHALTWAAVFWSLTVLLSILFSPHQADAAMFGIWLIVSALLAAAVPGAADTRKRLRPVVAAWFISAVIVTVAGQIIKPAPDVSAEASAEYGGAVITGRVTSVFSQPNEFGTYCMLMGLIALAVAFRAKGWLRWLALLTAVTTVIGLVESYSRGAWIGWVFGLLILVMIEPRARWPVIGGGVLAVLTFMGVAAALPGLPTVHLVEERVGTILNPRSNPDDNRPVLMAEGLRQFGTAPVFGWGPNVYPVEGGSSRSVERTVGGVHPHNIVILVAAEQGMFGLVAMLIIAGVVVVMAVPVLPVALRRLSRGRDPGGDWVAGVLAGTIAALCAMMVEGMVDAPLRNALMRTTLWLTIGVATSAALILRDQGTGTEPIDESGAAAVPALSSATRSDQ